MEGVSGRLYQVVVLCLEILPICELSGSEAEPESFAGVSRADTLLGSADSSFAFPFLQEAVCFLQDLRNNVRSIGEHESSLVVHTIGIQLLQFVEQLRNIDNYSVSKHVLAPRI